MSNLTLADVLRKTSAGRREQQQRSQALSARQRHVLILCDGQRAIGELCALMGQEVQELARELLAAGYVERVGLANAPEPVEAPLKRTSNASVQAPSAPEPSPSSVAASQLAQAVAPPPRRSIALSRMYMFDMLERLLGAQSGPARAHLRAADQPEAVLAALQECLALITEIAGSVQADKVRQQLCDMLPEDYRQSFAGQELVTS
ncbi:MAG: hypothetical protein J0I24_13360 [Thiomonas arsenitoxydans]|uniref:Uncharacterized protein n=1 Tax=Thiomonas arsenitoxydans (strain DSM 22701 / CIP 110005 / 3As) TaxID=426114 RepID=A0A8I1MZS5_THIA3|nr:MULTISPECIES: hypothetical protein [Thiomonas]MBN8745273.1 hypothetical protein [Thiomonas arsenitoxydans]ODU96829.1 MAG: hypothetical protein ABT24_07555 [Thiomonas sp. SCN 64-16]